MKIHFIYFTLFMAVLFFHYLFGIKLVRDSYEHGKIQSAEEIIKKISDVKQINVEALRHEFLNDKPDLKQRAVEKSINQFIYFSFLGTLFLVALILLPIFVKNKPAK